MFRQILLTIVLFSFVLLNGLDAKEARKEYPFRNEPIDVIIPFAEKDLDTLKLCIEGIKQNCTQIRRIIVVSSKSYTTDAEWFDEKQYPFTKCDIALLFFDDPNLARQLASSNYPHLGWYYQQLLKLYAPFVIPNLSSNVLVLDSDTIFLKPVKFLNRNGGGLYAPGTEHHLPYFDHAHKLTGGAVTRLFPRYSGISHHMLFQRSVLGDLFNEVEALHQQEFWRAFCLCVDKKEIHFSGASEYEIYFNYVFSKTDQVNLRFLKWDDITRLNTIENYRAQGYHYVSCHSWRRES